MTGLLLSVWSRQPDATSATQWPVGQHHASFHEPIQHCPRPRWEPGLWGKAEAKADFWLSCTVVFGELYDHKSQWQIVKLEWAWPCWWFLNLVFLVFLCFSVFVFWWIPHYILPNLVSKYWRFSIKSLSFKSCTVLLFCHCSLSFQTFFSRNCWHALVNGCHFWGDGTPNGTSLFSKIR